MTPELSSRLDELLAPGRRVLLGIVGPPASGKSTLAADIVQHANNHYGNGAAALLPMDGFHLADDVLVALGRRDRKGAPDTFDADGFVALLERVAAHTDPVVYAPEFRREIEASLAGAIPIPSAARLVIVEGNYLLLDTEPWSRVRNHLTEVWYLDVPAAVRNARLIERHRPAYGDDAEAWVAKVDQPNALTIEASRDRADHIVAAHDRSGNR